MVSTKAGWLDKKEIVEVVFDPKVTPYAELLKAARCVKDPSTAYVYDAKLLDEAKQHAGEDAALTKAKPRDAKASDQKYYLRKTAYHYLPLTEVQAARLNAMLADGETKPRPDTVLSPSQRALQGWTPPGAISSARSGDEALALCACLTLKFLFTAAPAPRFRCASVGIVDRFQHSRWPEKFTRLWRAASLIEKETFGARFRNRCLLGFACRKNTSNM